MLTPLDIENRKLKRAIFGYSKIDVETFLSEIIVDYENVYKDNIILKDKVELLNNAIAQYKSIENTLQNALVSAQTASEEMKINAKKESEMIIREAEQRSSEMVSDAYRKISALKEQYESAKTSMNIYRAKINSLLVTQLETIKGISEAESSEFSEDVSEFSKPSKVYDEDIRQHA